MIKIEDVQTRSYKRRVVVSGRISQTDKDFIKRNHINIGLLIEHVIDSMRKEAEE